MNFSHLNLEYLAIVFAVVFASMVLHELMHGVVALWLGDDTAKRDGRLTLNPLKHIDPFLTIILPLFLAAAGLPIFGGARPVPFRPDRVRGGDWGVALVGIAGPLTNLALAFLCFGALAIFHISGVGVLSQILSVGVMANLGFFAFNILPVPPLDGSRVLYAVAPEWFRRAMEAVERAGLIVVFAIVMFASPAISQVIGYIIQFMLAFFAAIFGVAAA